MNVRVKLRTAKMNLFEKRRKEFFLNRFQCSLLLPCDRFHFASAIAFSDKFGSSSLKRYVKDGIVYYTEELLSFGWKVVASRTYTDNDPHRIITNKKTFSWKNVFGDHLDPLQPLEMTRRIGDYLLVVKSGSDIEFGYSDYNQTNADIKDGYVRGVSIKACLDSTFGHVFERLQREQKSFGTNSLYTQVYGLITSVMKRAFDYFKTVEDRLSKRNLTEDTLLELSRNAWEIGSILRQYLEWYLAILPAELSFEVYKKTRDEIADEIPPELGLEEGVVEDAESDIKYENQKRTFNDWCRTMRRYVDTLKPQFDFRVEESIMRLKELRTEFGSEFLLVRDSTNPIGGGNRSEELNEEVNQNILKQIPQDDNQSDPLRRIFKSNSQIHGLFEKVCNLEKDLQAAFLSLPKAVVTSRRTSNGKQTEEQELKWRHISREVNFAESQLFVRYGCLVQIGRRDINWFILDSKRHIPFKVQSTEFPNLKLKQVDVRLFRSHAMLVHEIMPENQAGAVGGLGGGKQKLKRLIFWRLDLKPLRKRKRPTLARIGGIELEDIDEYAVSLAPDWVAVLYLYGNLLLVSMRLLSRDGSVGEVITCQIPELFPIVSDSELPPELPDPDDMFGMDRDRSVHFKHVRSYDNRIIVQVQSDGVAWYHYLTFSFSKKTFSLSSTVKIKINFSVSLSEEVFFCKGFHFLLVFDASLEIDDIPNRILNLYYISKTRMQLVTLKSAVKTRIKDILSKFKLKGAFESKIGGEANSMRKGAQKVRSYFEIEDILQGMVELKRTDIFLCL